MFCLPGPPGSGPTQGRQQQPEEGQRGGLIQCRPDASAHRSPTRATHTAWQEGKLRGATAQGGDPPSASIQPGDFTAGAPPPLLPSGRLSHLRLLTCNSAQKHMQRRVLDFTHREGATTASAPPRRMDPAHTARSRPAPAGGPRPHCLPSPGPASRTLPRPRCPHGPCPGLAGRWWAWKPCPCPVPPSECRLGPAAPSDGVEGGSSASPVALLVAHSCGELHLVYLLTVADVWGSS